MLSVPLYVTDIDLAKDFYCKKLPFEISSNPITPIKTQFSIKGITENIEISIILSTTSIRNEILKKRESWLSFEKIDVEKLYSSIKEKIPQFDGPGEELPNGQFSGLLECPGGLFMTMYDPFGNRLEFCTW